MALAAKEKKNQISSIISDEVVLERKIILATEGFTNTFCEQVLRDRNRLSKENTLTVAEYIIAMKREINPRLSYVRNTIHFLSEIARSAGQKSFRDMTKEDILHYLDLNRKSENVDPLHKWIGSYNTKRITIIRFFKWLYYPNIGNPNLRNEISTKERKPDCIMDVPQLKIKGIGAIIQWPEIYLHVPMKY
jgi:site-specific recombinase XerD